MVKIRQSLGGKPIVSNRGGNYGNGSNAGSFYLNLNNSRTTSNTNLGFRAALLLWSDAANLWVRGQYREDKGACSHAGRQKIKMAANIAGSLMWRQQ